MERKKKHSIIWLIIIIIAIIAIVLITIAGARNGDNTAYAAEVESSDTGIINSSVWNGNSTEPTQTLYFSNNGKSNQSRGVIQFEPIQTNKEYTINIAFIGNALISNNRQAISYVFNTQGNFNGATYGSTTQPINPDGMTEINLTYTDTQAVNYFIFEFYNNANSTGTANQYWVNLLLFQIGDGSGNYLVNYQSYLYDYLKTQYDNANSSGYENGLNDGESLYRNNPFNGAVLISATVIKDKYNITNAPLNLLSNGISFSSLQSAAADHMDGKEEFEGEQGWTVKFSVIPFIFKQNQIYISQSYGFASLIMTDINNNTYNISWGDTLTKLGYALTESTAYGKTIKQIQITFANLDYVGTLYVGQTAAQDSAYNEGYNKGYNQGHIDGYNQATTDSNGPAWAINKLVSTVSAGLSTDIIGEISVMLGILLTFAVIRFFGGG